MLSLSATVPKVFKGLTSGLLGNYDGNPENDFVNSSGMVFPGNMTEREIFYYARTCKCVTNSSKKNNFSTASVVLTNNTT